VKHLQLELTALSPLAIRSDHAPGGAATAKVIPGSSLAGCLASVHRLLRREKTEEFEELFLKGQVHYPHLYPATLKISQKIAKESEKDIEELKCAKIPIYPVPMTAQTCKKQSGFLFPRDEKEDRHGVRDSLLDWAIFSLLTKDSHSKREVDALNILHVHHLCKVETREAKTCEALMHPFKGYYRRSSIPSSEDGKFKYIQADVLTRLQTRTGISREWGIVEGSILYSREVVEDGMCFCGVVKLPEKLEPAFTQLLEEATVSNTGTRQNSSLLRIGTGRTRGLGAVNIVNRGEEQHELDIFKKRLTSFNTALIKRAKAANVQDRKPFYIVLTMHSPMILHDQFMRYQGTISPETLAKKLDLCVKDVQLIYHAARLEHITGWQELWGTPRFKECAIATGSVFLFGLSHEPDDVLWHKLFTLEEEGMGERRADGFGRVMLSDPFHLQEEEVLR
jgi:CRISPR-associated protein Csx10